MRGIFKFGVQYPPCKMSFQYYFHNHDSKLFKTRYKHIIFKNFFKNQTLKALNANALMM